MFFSEEDAPLLKAWIVKRIENTSDADADVLAEYIIALLKHDGDEASVRSLCEQEIPDFLTEDSKQFLDDVFQAVTYRSYVPGAPAPPPPKPSPMDTKEPPAAPANPQQQQPRKRRFEETVAPNDHDRNGSHGRAPKHARRGRRGGHAEDRAAYGQGHQSQMQGQNYPMGLMMPPLDPNNPMEALMSMQAMSMAFPMMGDASSGWFGPAPGRGERGSKRRRCRDFDQKGYCSRGSTCNFDHAGGVEAANQEEYDPVNAMILPFPPADLNNMGRERGGRRGGQRGGGRGGGRAAFSAEGPVTDKSKTTIVVENIPEEYCSEEKVRGFFSQYGDIVELSMLPYKHLAIIKFQTWASANDAYRSPKVIFDNRFVKVFWYKDPSMSKPNMPVSSSSSVIPNGASNTNQPFIVGGDEANSPEPEIDMEEFQRKQDEAQKLHQKREEKKTELQKQREQLEAKQQELLAKHRAETERLRAKLAAKNGTADASLGQTGSSSSADLLRAKLAALEQEAKMLGIDPDAAAAEHHPFRGGYRGRGYRGRGAFGAYRGRGGAGAAAGAAAAAAAGGSSFQDPAGRHAAYAQFSIDNRPRRLAVKGVDFTPSERDEQLRHFLLNLGEFESVDTSASVTHVSFRDRKTAEKFYFSLHGKEFPGLQGTLELSWVNNAASVGGAASANAGSLKKKTTMTTEEGGAAEGGAAGDDAMAGVEGRENADEREERRAVDMDYEAEGW
ncbi:hypothetical protein E4U57_000481 [Claviceps arundinis]|uniref:CCCH zinc finger and RRM domain-containing protein n=1 Tax=Claviceps arundinis TaxID=1623583 RepID=A0ABQ7PCZ2_9HYPO|nr:hypothetical protein E4U57_000481 [Claviceps arundinis]